MSAQRNAPSLAEKRATLAARLRGLERVLVAYSGGIDSTLLAVVARDELGDRTKAVLATSPTYPRHEAQAARELARELGLNLLEVESGELDAPAFAENTPKRCYHCKTELFGLLGEVARREGLRWIADGTNADDLSDHRPGRQAAAEAGAVSPLAEAGLTKADIRAVSRDLGLPNWDKPSMACLASRFPYGNRITAEELARVESAENALRALGIGQFRVRAHGPVARVEVAPGELEHAWGRRGEVAAAVRRAGFAYAALDLEGYRTGSLNEVLGEDGADNASL